MNKQARSYFPSREFPFGNGAHRAVEGGKVTISGSWTRLGVIGKTVVGLPVAFFD